MSSQFVVSRVGDYRLALPIQQVERVLPAAAVTAVPDAPPILLGVLVLAGEIVPILDVHSRLSLGRGPIRAGERFVVARAGRQRVGLAVDEVIGIENVSVDAITLPAAVASQTPHIEGLAVAAGGIALVQDLDRFLSLDEAVRVQQVIDGPDLR